MPSKRVLAFLLFTSHLSCVGDAIAQVAPQDAERPPNIVLIVADDLGYGDLACYGHPRNRTPHIDRLAREGLKFTDFHSNGPMCSPTRAALLTGLYQNRFGKAFEHALSAKSPQIGLPVDAITIAEILNEAGYATGMYGKWHLGYQPPHMPTDFGFEDFRGLLTGDGDHISHISRSGTKDWYHNDGIEIEEGYATELITDHSIDFIRRHQSRPFFVYVAHLAIHFPWQGPGETAHRVEGKDYWSLEKLGPHSEGEVGPVVCAMVEAVDNSVGRIMAALRELKLEDETFVFFTSDNGGYLEYEGRFAGELSRNAPCRGEKGELWEGGHRVPAIAWWPGHIEPGTHTRETATTMDLAPTFIEMAGAQIRSDFDGVSLTSHIVYGDALPHRDLFWRAGDLRAVRRGPWKLIDDHGKLHLFNLAEDIGEREDLSNEEPELIRKLLMALAQWEEDVGGSEHAAEGRPRQASRFRH